MLPAQAHLYGRSSSSTSWHFMFQISHTKYCVLCYAKLIKYTSFLPMPSLRMSSQLSMGKEGVQKKQLRHLLTPTRSGAELLLLLLLPAPAARL